MVWPDNNFVNRLLRHIHILYGINVLVAGGYKLRFYLEMKFILSTFLWWMKQKTPRKKHECCMFKREPFFLLIPNILLVFPLIPSLHHSKHIFCKHSFLDYSHICVPYHVELKHTNIQPELKYSAQICLCIIFNWLTRFCVTVCSLLQFPSRDNKLFASIEVLMTQSLLLWHFSCGKKREDKTRKLNFTTKLRIT